MTSGPLGFNYESISFQAKEKSQIEFTFYPPRGKPITTFASPDEQLAVAVEKTGVKNFCFENHILFAEVKDQSSEVAVLPGILCRELKPGGKVKTKGHKGATPWQKIQDDRMDESEKENELPIKAQKLIFIESTSRGITKIPTSMYNGKLLAILAYDGDTVDDAIVKDGRFSEGVNIFETNDREAQVPQHYAAADLARRILMMKKRPSKRKTASFDKNDIPSTTDVFSIPGDLKDPFTEDIGRAAINSVRQNALEHFAKPGATKTVDEYIKRGIEQFGKENPAAIPAHILDTLARAKKSVGNIVCGGRKGTCFVLAFLRGQYAIITSKHVINIINEERKATTDQERYDKISVHFDDNYPEQVGACIGEVDENAHTFYDEHLDYAIMFLKPSPDLGNLPLLGSLVRSSIPCHGIVVLIGYPENLSRKSVEDCHVIPDNWHETLCDRATKVLGHGENPQEYGIRSSQNRDVVHMAHKVNIVLPRDIHSNGIPYDTSFFHGSSGSPVFNSDGHIIAIHTLGYPYLRGTTQYSIMEFGKALGAICRDVRSKHGDKVANFLFPKCGN